jgi:hypothetical protein
MFEGSSPLQKPPAGHPHYLPEIPAEKKEEKPAMASAAAVKYQELRNKIAEAKKKMEETAKGLFSEMAADLFKDNPTLVAFSWPQYTPYYNDGDECVFSARIDYPNVSMLVDGDTYSFERYSTMLVNGKEAETAEKLTEQFKSMGVDSFAKNGKIYAYDKKTGAVTINGDRAQTYKDIQKLFEPMENIVASFLSNFEDDDMKTMFGDHIEVTVNRDGTISTEHHEHD